MWVDFLHEKDKKWKEAQIIDRKLNILLVHVNGSDHQVNEWVDIQSQRIMPFRSHTCPKHSSNFNSPNPSLPMDGSTTRFPKEKLDINRFFFNIGSLMIKLGKRL